MAGEQNSAAGSPQRAISFNVNGVSRLQNNTKLDGASVVYPWLPTNTAYVPSSEAISEVSIVTNSHNAEQGLAGGAAINVVIKSGTNRFRGTAWGYNTDYDLRARNFFLTANTPKPDGYLNQFGGNIGGPIVKNKLFFFANSERTKRENIAPVRQFSLATEALRRGDFSSAGVTIYDPASNPDPAQRTPFPGNVIPQDRIDPAALELIRRLPLPNGAGFTNNYQAQGTEDYKRDNNDFKVDYHPSSRLSLFGRYSYSPSQIFDPPRSAKRAAMRWRAVSLATLLARRTSPVSARRIRSGRRCCSTATSDTHANSLARKVQTSAPTSASTCCGFPARTDPIGCRAACPRSR